MRKEILSDKIELWCGDCRDVISEVRSRVSSVITDPPYGANFVSNYRKNKHSEIIGDSNNEALNWACNLEPNHSAYIFGRWQEILCIPRPKSVITWVKNNWSMGDLDHEHARQTELIFFYPGINHFFPHGRPQDVIDFRRVPTDRHPTEKPIALMENILRWTAGVVLDPFMGSGSTGVAAAKMGREFIGVELNENYFDIACKRISEAVNPRQMALL